MTNSFLAPLLVRASAGTGKTYQLTGRLLRILLQDTPPETILATTFTRKAAGEITDRLLEVLAAAAEPDDASGLQALRKQIELPGLTTNTCLQQFDKLLRNIHRLRVCTLDSLFSQLAKSFPFEMNLPPTWRLTDEFEETWFRERAVAALIDSASEGEIHTILSMLSKGEVSRSVEQELLNVVNAGYAASRGCDADVWDKVVAKRQPAQPQIDQAITDIRAASPRQKQLQTVLAKTADILESGEFDLLPEQTLIANIAKARRSRAAVKFGRSVFPPGLDEAFDTLYALARSICLAKLGGQNRATGAVLEMYDHHVTQLKQSARAIGFQDVAFRLAQFADSLDSHTLARRIDGAINHILLDEFQDTSPVQWQILRPLAQRVTDYTPDPSTLVEAEHAERSFFCVGDPKQAIYGWRGGVAEIFAAVTDQLSGVCERGMHHSYRSSPVVIEFVNQIFCQLDRHPQLGNRAEYLPSEPEFYFCDAIQRFATGFAACKHQSQRPELRGMVRIETAARATTDDAEPAFQRAAEIAVQIRRHAPDKSIGILTRSNDGVARVIRQLELQKTLDPELEFSQEGGNPLTDSAAVDLVLSALMMSEHPGDLRWKFHTDHSPLADIAGFNADLVRERLTEFGLAEAVEWLARHLEPVCDRHDAARLKQLVHLATSYQSRSGPRVRDFVGMVQQQRVQRPQMAQIVVMTVHQAKGLEFDAVILPELDAPLTRISGLCMPQVPEPGNPPVALSRYLTAKQWHFLSNDWQHAFGSRAAAAMTEAICLLYVAITRARQAVHVVIEPQKKQEFEAKTSAALIFHAIGKQLGDPSLVTSPDQELYLAGDPHWYRS